jgi:1,6-anhydro-N-acetylmuramate kinase
MGFYLGLMSGTSMDAIDAAILRRDTTFTGLSLAPPKSSLYALSFGSSSFITLSYAGRQILQHERY